MRKKRKGQFNATVIADALMGESEQRNYNDELRSEYPQPDLIYRVAGQLAGATTFNEKTAKRIAYRALMLWDACHEVLEERVETGAEVLAASEAFALPSSLAKLPKSFEEGLKNLVGGKYVADRMHIFRCFLQNNPQMEQDIGRWRTNGFASQTEWEALAVQFVEWRNERRSTKARNAAKARHKKKSKKSLE